jgi:DNA-binding transcriptional MerR regulator
VANTRTLKIGSESRRELSYLLGLFLADGYADIVKVKPGSRNYRIRFFLQKNQLQIAERIAVLLRKLGLNPNVENLFEKGMSAVRVYSRALLCFLPDKKTLVNEVSQREIFFRKNRLFDVEYGIPFVAGLLDGDGSCQVIVPRRCFKSVSVWNWNFSQSREYYFLVDYFKMFVESLSPGRHSTWTTVFRNGVKRLSIRKPGAVALIESGINEYSWKVSEWSKEVAEARLELAEYHTTGEVARSLGVSYPTVESWVKSGKVRQRVRWTDKKQSWFYLHDDDIMRFDKELREKRKKAEDARSCGMRLKAVAELLGISVDMLHYLKRHERLDATLVDEGSGVGHRYLVVRRDETQRLKEEYRPRRTRIG